MRSQIEAKINRGERINDEEARFLYTEASLPDLKDWATRVRARMHKPDQATYLIMRIINYTNVCVAKCDYCSFYRLPRSPEGYVLPLDAIFAKIDEILALGGDFVAFNGGFNPRLKLDWYENTFSRIREKYGDSIEFFALTVAEMMYVAKLCRLSYREVCLALKEGFRIRHIFGRAEIAGHACGLRFADRGDLRDDGGEIRFHHRPDRRADIRIGQRSAIDRVELITRDLVTERPLEEIHHDRFRPIAGQRG